MKKFVAFATVATAVSFFAASAQAGGWGSSYSYNGNNNYSSGLVNVSPSIKTGDIGVLNGLAILNQSPIASGNVVKGILSDNGILGGSSVLNGNSSGIGILGVGSNLLKGGKRR